MSILSKIKDFITLPLTLPDKDKCCTQKLMKFETEQDYFEKTNELREQGFRTIQLPNDDKGNYIVFASTPTCSEDWNERYLKRNSPYGEHASWI